MARHNGGPFLLPAFAIRCMPRMVLCRFWSIADGLWGIFSGFLGGFFVFSRKHEMNSASQEMLKSTSGGFYCFGLDSDVK